MDGERSVATVAIAVAIGVVLGLAGGWLFHPSAESPRAAEPSLGVVAPEGSPFPTGTPPDPAAANAEASRVTAQQQALAGALLRGAQGAGAGTVQVAVMLDTARAPSVSGPGADVPMRTWSMVKPVTTLALLGVRNGPLGDLAPVIQRALTRSDNCAQRKLVLELFDELKSWPAVAQTVADTVSRAEAAIDMNLAQLDQDGDAECVSPGYAGLPPEDANRPSLLIGVTEWRVSDAVRVAAALRGGRTYGAAVSDYVLGQMRAPKQDSDAPGSAEQLTAPPNWGAGQVFAAPCWKVAYKGGWGGSEQQRFLAGQLGVVDLADGHWAAFAVMFHPTTQPSDDDPGKTQAPAAISAGLEALKQGLHDLNPGCS